MAEPRTLSVLTLNTYLCRVVGVDLCPLPDRRAALISEGLRELDPDIACFQEMWDPRLGAEALAGLKSHHVAQGERPSRKTPMGSGLAIASRAAIRESRFIPIVTTWRPKELLARRGVLISRIENGSSGMEVMVTHLGMGTIAGRRRQHAEMLAALPETDRPCILCGDLNLTCEEERSRGFRVLSELQARGFRDALREVHGAAADELASVSRANPLVHRAENTRIDHIWVRSGRDAVLKVREARRVFDQPVDGLYPSDHFGFLVRLSVET